MGHVILCHYVGLAVGFGIVPRRVISFKTFSQTTDCGFFLNRLGIVWFMLAENGPLYGFDKKHAATVTRVESRHQLSEALLEFEYSEWHALFI